MKHPVFRILAVLVLASFSVLATAQQYSSGTAQVSVLELFTSEGCSSCPPAEKWMSSLTQHPDLWNRLIPVVFHVDYWDYIGWKDPFADRTFTHRQQRYGQQLGMSTIYTPGFFLNGEEWKRWFGLRALNLPNLDNQAQLKANVDASVATVEYTPRTKSTQLQISMAILGFDISSDVSRGENRGKTLTHNFTVLSFETQSFNTENMSLVATLSIPENIPPAKRYALAFWVHKKDSLKPLQATGGWWQPPN